MPPGPERRAASPRRPRVDTRTQPGRTSFGPRIARVGAVVSACLRRWSVPEWAHVRSQPVTTGEQVRPQPRRFYDGGVLPVGDRIGLPPDPAHDPADRARAAPRGRPRGLQPRAAHRLRRPAPRRDPRARDHRLPHRPDLDAGAVHLAGAQDRRAPAGGAGPRRPRRGRRRAVLRLDRGPHHRPGGGRPGLPRRDGRHRHRRRPAMDRLDGGHRRDDLRPRRPAPVAGVVTRCALGAPRRRRDVDRGDPLPRLLRHRRPGRPVAGRSRGRCRGWGRGPGGSSSSAGCPARSSCRWR